MSATKRSKDLCWVYGGRSEHIWNGSLGKLWSCKVTETLKCKVSYCQDLSFSLLFCLPPFFDSLTLYPPGYLALSTSRMFVTCSLLLQVQPFRFLDQTQVHTSYLPPSIVNKTLYLHIFLLIDSPNRHYNSSSSSIYCMCFSPKNAISIEIAIWHCNFDKSISYDSNIYSIWRLWRAQTTPWIIYHTHVSFSLISRSGNKRTYTVHPIRDSTNISESLSYR